MKKLRFRKRSRRSAIVYWIKLGSDYHFMSQISINRPFLYKTVVSAHIYIKVYTIQTKGYNPLFMSWYGHSIWRTNKQDRYQNRTTMDGAKKLGVKLTMDGPQTGYVPIMRQSEPKTMAETHTSSHREPCLNDLKLYEKAMIRNQYGGSEGTFCFVSTLFSW